MKKSFVKFIALALVLIMVLGAVPVSAASKTIENAGSLLNDMFGWLFMPIPQGSAFPEQEFLPPEVDGVTVTVRAPEGALPAGTDIEVAPVDMAAVQNAVDASSEVSGTVLAAVDITFRYRGEEIQPNAPVTVTMTSAALEGQDNLNVVHIDDQRASHAESVFAEFEEDTATFEADKFSVYAVIDESGSNSDLITVEFYAKKNGQWEKINAQAVRRSMIESMVAAEMDPVFDPGVPSITEGQSFEGWADTSAHAVSDDYTGLSVAEINDYVVENKDNTNITTITYYAMVFNVRYVVYHDQAGAVLMTQSYHIHEGQNTENVKIQFPYTAFKGEQNFAGWIEEEYVEVAGDYPLYKDTLNTAYVSAGNVYKDGTTYALDETLQLYPYLNTGHWLVFDNYISQDDDTTSASYTSPVFYADGVNTVAPAKPTRTGYEFKGWYRPTYDSEGKVDGFGSQFVFGSPISEDTTVVAKWEAKNTTYHVVYWVQKVTDGVDTDDEDKEYDFYDSRLETAMTGDPVSIENEDTLLGYNEGSTDGGLGYYYIYNETNTDTASKVVKGDGSTVLNVYYDRKVITFKYYETDKTTPWTPSGSGYVAAENGAYYHYDAQDSGYYLIGTGPNSSYRPSQGDTIYYLYSINSTSYPTVENADTYFRANYPYFASNNSSIKTYSYNASDDLHYANSGSLYEYYQFSGYSYYSWIAYYYSFTEQYTTGYYAVGTGPNPTAAGTHNLSGGAGSNVISGLYGAQLPSTDWPVSDSGYRWANDETISGETETYYYPLALTEYVPVQSEGAADTVEMHFYLSADSGTEMHIYYVGQSIGGGDTDFTVPLTSGVNRVGSNGATWYPNETIEGFTVSKYRFGTSGNWNNCTTSTGITLSSGSADLYVGFTRNTYKFEFYSNNETVTPDSLPAGTDLNAVPYKYALNAFMGAVPNNDPEGYYFDGWYADPAFDTEFDFDSTMPANNVRVYAKWTMIRFRVVLDPTGGEEGVTPSDITFPGNQATTFRVDYGEQVQASSINNAQREGYTLLGWYLDKEHTIPFNFGNPVTDEIADMTYADASDEERQGVDPWTLENDAPKPYTDVGLPNVRGKVTIYAKWRQDPDGVIGINVKYDATDKNGNTGKFAFNNSDTWIDPNIYADKAMAFGQAASTPDNSDLQFLYWEILDKYGNVVGKAYPGQLWEVDFNYAKEESLTAQAVYYTYEDYLSGIKAVEEPAANANASVPTREGTRAVATYQQVSTPTPGKRYLITYVTGGTAYIMGNTYNSTSQGGSSPRATTSATVSGSTISGDFDQYLFGVNEEDGDYQFGSLSKIAYLNIVYVEGWSSNTGYLNFGSSTYGTYNGSNVPNTWWTYSDGKLSNWNTNIGSNYLYIRCNGNGSNRRFELSGSGNASTITFFERVEDATVSGEEFDLTTELKVGGSYIIAIGDHAVGNQALNSSSNDHFIKEIPVSAKTSSVVVPTAEVDNATWEVVSGDANNGYILRNKGNGTYLGMSSDGQCYLAATSENLAAHWTYDNGTDLNNHVEEASNYSSSNSKYFYYLSFSTSFMDFTTTINNGQGVKLYSVTKSYTVTFVDGYNNQTIKTETVEEGQSATAPEAPDHSDQGMIFNGWDKDYSNIQSDLTVTAQYVSQSSLSYTVTFHYMNSNGEWVSTSQTVQHGQAAVEPDVPTPPAGYTFNSWDKKFNNITSNLTVNAVYKQEATTKYEITLRALYGRANTTAKTHVYWYGNNDATGEGPGVVQKNEELQINQAMDIPTPESFDEGIHDFSNIVGGSKADPSGLVWEDHVFLGWARLDNETGSESEAKAHPELGVDDIYLAWDPTGNKGNGDFIIMKAPTAVDDPQATVGKHVTKVAADESHPYHDMYAVWADIYYVYHSATNKVERKIYIPTREGDNTIDLVAMMDAEVNNGSVKYLYGGYYSEYNGASTAVKEANYKAGELFPAADAISFTWDNVQNKTITWTNDDKTATDAGTPYTGAQADAWNKAKAFGSGTRDGDVNASENGKSVTPVGGRTYYIKEVPAEMYLQPYMHYTYYVSNNQLADAWLISDLDDLNYNGAGFLIIDTQYGVTNVVKSLSVWTEHGQTLETLTAKKLFGATEGTDYLSYRKVIDDGEYNYLSSANHVVLNYWITPDGLRVTGVNRTTYTGLTGAVQQISFNNPTGGYSVALPGENVN